MVIWPGSPGEQGFKGGGGGGLTALVATKRNEPYSITMG